MGAQESSLASQATVAKGFHILRVAENSPAADAGLEPFFDYVVGVDGKSVTEDGETLTKRLEESEGISIGLQIYSSRRQEVRSIKVVPNRHWSSSGSSRDSSQQPSLLGLSLRLCTPANALENVWHILDVVEGSPAQDAGLVPFGDWVIGYAGGVLRGEDDFYQVVEDHEDRPLRLFVYNADYEVTREVVIMPNRSWGNGEGLLGCSIGFGILHRIPKTTATSAARLSASPTAPSSAHDNGTAPARGGFFSPASYSASPGVELIPTPHHIDGYGELNGGVNVSEQNPLYHSRLPQFYNGVGSNQRSSVAQAILEEEETSPSMA